jgi:ABC-type thiamin/hydroxymethylpyrimidine transport system permease subunit
MIAVESFQRFKIHDGAAILLLAGAWYGVSKLASLLSPQSSYLLSLLMVMFLLSFTVHLIRKAGAATLFCLTGALLTFSFNDLGATGIPKLLVFLMAGIVFELGFLLFKLEFKNVQVDILLGTAFAAASIPFTTGMLLSSGVTLTMLTAMLNLILTSFFVGVIGAILSFLLWYHLRTTKWVLKFEYGG